MARRGAVVAGIGSRAGESGGGRDRRGRTGDALGDERVGAGQRVQEGIPHHAGILVHQTPASNLTVARPCAFWKNKKN